jgi:hypothetical protein
MSFRAKRLLVPLLVLYLGMVLTLVAIALGVFGVVHFVRGKHALR